MPLSLSTDTHLEDLFSDTIDGLAACDGRDDMTRSFDRIVVKFGLKHVAYVVLNLPGKSHRLPTVITTYASDWVDRYQTSQYFRYDPVITAGFKSILPLHWDEFDLSNRRIRHLFGEAVEFGVGRNGLSFPIRGRHGEYAMFSITSDDTRAEWDRKKRLYIRDFQMIAYHVHRSVLRLEGVSLPVVKLSPQEHECLRWIAMGKTIPDTASIMGLKDRTVRYYLETARGKLQAINTINAIAKAISLNLLSVGF